MGKTGDVKIPRFFMCNGQLHRMEVMQQSFHVLARPGFKIAELLKKLAIEPKG